MINHISIGVHNPEKVANFIAEIWDGYVLPFPPSPESFIVLADDGKGTAVEVTPSDIVLEPGEGYPAEQGFTSSTPTEEFEARFQRSGQTPEYVATHLALNTYLSESEVKKIANREGWRNLTCNRGEGLFQLVEVWVEDRFLLEVFTPEMTRRYQEVLEPRAMAEAMNITLPPKTIQPVSEIAFVT